MMKHLYCLPLLMLCLGWSSPGASSDSETAMKIAPGEKDRIYAEYQRTQSMIDFLSNILRSPETLVLRSQLRGSDSEPSEIISKAAELRQTLVERQKELLEGIALPQRGAYDSMEARPFRMSEGRLQLEGSLQQALGGGSLGCPDLTLGQVKASGFRHYAWAPADNGSGTIVFWPGSDTLTQVPTESYNGDWSGETGAQFLGTATTGSFDFSAAAGVLQFTLPALGCDSVVYWGTTARAKKEGPWTFQADGGWLDTEWVLMESPDGAGFPTSYISGFTRFDDGLWGSAAYPENEWKISDRQDFNRSFEVEANVSPKIYLGLSLGLWVNDGTVMTAFLDSFGFDYGITYFIVPRESTEQ